MTTAGGAGIRAALGRLGELAGETDSGQLAMLRERLDSARLRVLVVGEAKRGKSTLVNALLGREVLPAGVLPLTAVPTTVRLAAPGEEGIEVAFAGGGTGRFPLAALADFGTERGNPGNRRRVAAITVGLDAPVLARGAELVDMPGTGSVYEHNTAAADAALPSMDAAIFVLTADPPMSASERELLRRVAGLSAARFIVLNKTDYLDSASLAEAREFTARVVAEATGQPERVYPMSARAAGGTAGDPGFAAFAGDFGCYLDTGRGAGLEESATRHARDIGQQLLDETRLAQRAARLPGGQATAQVAAFRGRLEAIAGRRTAAGDVVSAESARLLEALNAAAERARAVLPGVIRGAMTELLHGELSAASPDDIERRGRASLTRLAAEAAESWRQEQAGHLEQGLRRIDGTLAAELEAGLAAVRAAAADLLGAGLALPPPGDRLPASLGFFYDLGEQVDQAELLAGAIRRRLPGGYGRRLARQRLLSQAGDLVDSLIGRGRGDLQYRLAEATRRMLADLRHRYAAATGRLDSALERAARIRDGAGEQAGAELAELAAREQTLRDLLGMLSCHPPPGS